MTELLFLIDSNAGIFRDDFRDWLFKNGHIWIEFKERALRMARRRSHYSAYTIWYAIRFDTDLTEVSDSSFKLNNNFIPDCARLFELVHPGYTGFFERRSSPTMKRAA
jgi:hypothetical protein